MRKSMTFLTLILAIAASAQTLNVRQGNLLYAFPSFLTDEMTYAEGGTEVTIMDKTFALDQVDQMYVDETEVELNTVQVAYNGMSATVTIAGNIAPYVTATVSGAHVSVVQSSDVSADAAGEITYILSGSSADGEFYTEGSYKATVELNGLTLTNPTGPAINIQNGKRINISV